MTDPAIIRALNDAQKRAASLFAENLRLQQRLHRMEMRSERDVVLINRLSGMLAQLDAMPAKKQNEQKEDRCGTA